MIPKISLVQNYGRAWWQVQCEYYSTSAQCWCCCQSDQCNYNALWCSREALALAEFGGLQGNYTTNMLAPYQSAFQHVSSIYPFNYLAPKSAFNFFAYLGYPNGK